MLSFVFSFIIALDAECLKFKKELFQFAVKLGSLPQISSNESYISFRDVIINILAKKCGLSTKEELFTSEIADFLQEIMKEYKKWNNSSPNRYAFNMLLDQSNEAVDGFWEIIIIIAASSISKDKQYLLIFDTVDLIRKLIEKRKDSQLLSVSAISLLDDVIIPSARWKAGAPYTNIRELSLKCYFELLKNNLVDKEKLHPKFKDHYSVIKGCLDDDYSPNLRYVSLVLIDKLLSYLAGKWDCTNVI